MEFRGKQDTPDPYWGPDTYVEGIQNLVYSATWPVPPGDLPPGQYDVIISHGPEYDAVFTSIEVARGIDATLEARLRRSVETPGWVSSDFHSHATPSGDNTSSQRGRVLNLLCEHLEFSPCTEHNRISTYEPHLKFFQSEHLMATCSGMELTGQPLPVNHQNAFPLAYRPRTQDGGGPRPDENPVVQIERLALWDQRSQKVVQGNHPNLMQVLGDRDLDGVPDGGFERMLGSMDVVEVHPPQDILQLSNRSARSTRTRERDLQLVAAIKPRLPRSRRGQYRRALQLPRLRLAPELSEEPHRRPRQDQDGRHDSSRGVGAYHHDQRSVPGGARPCDGR